MWIPAGAVYLLAALALSVEWLHAVERQVLRQTSRAMFKGGWLGVLVALLIGLSSCNQEVERAAAAMTGGEPGIGKQVMQQYGCASCHTIPGIPGARALVGPSLEHIASRMYIAGVLPNTPENMLRWLQNPLAVDPLTAMPNLGVTEADARHMAGYLYTLR
jgi:cytochrome c2